MTFDVVKYAIDPDGGIEPRDFAEYRGISDGDVADDLFLEAFVSGARTFHDEVEDQL